MITITIRTTTPAFGDGCGNDEVARILRQLATQFDTGAFKLYVIDANGNTCGKVTLTGKDRK